MSDDLESFLNSVLGLNSKPKTTKTPISPDDQAVSVGASGSPKAGDPHLEYISGGAAESLDDAAERLVTELFPKDGTPPSPKDFVLLTQACSLFLGAFVCVHEVLGKDQADENEERNRALLRTAGALCNKAQHMLAGVRSVNICVSNPTPDGDVTIQLSANVEIKKPKKED